MHKKEFAALRVRPGTRLSLAEVPTAPPSHHSASSLDEIKSDISRLSERMNKLQSRLHASDKRGVLLVLQGMDTSGKDSAIRHVFSHVSPLGVRAEPFGAPSDEESHHDFLWRVHAKVPKRGELVIFNRSHYEDVLVTRVRGWIKQAVWERRYEHIRHFEQMLHDEGIVIIKCYLHISKQEQKHRLQARMDDPDKQWKLQPSDFEDRKRWAEYIDAYQDALVATSTETAPWWVIPADSKPHRDHFLMRLLVDELEALKLVPLKPRFEVGSFSLD